MKQCKNVSIHTLGFSVIDVLLAAALFLIFATGAVTVVLQGLDANRLGAEETIANQFAAEGIEAVRSIKNQAYTNLTTVSTATRGVVKTAGVWQFRADGTNDTLTHNSTDNYIRTVKVENVSRDGPPPTGNIVASLGTPDPQTKKITSTVSWNFNSARADSVNLIEYMTNWKNLINIGIIMYGDATTIPKYRFYTGSNNSFGAEITSAPTGAQGKNFTIKTSPIKQEAIAGYVDSTTGTLRVLCYDGIAWTSEWSVVVGGTATTRRFDIAYETNSGDILVAYSRNAAATNAVDYRTKLGTTGCGSANWSAAASLPTTTTLTSGTVHWVKMGWDRRSTSNLITAIWADSNSDLGAAVWSGTAWGNLPSAALETSLEVVTAAQDVDDFDVEYESLSGDVMVVWANSVGSNGTNGVRYKTCTNGTATCTWNATTTPPTFVDDATNLDISANPNTDELVFASIGNAGSDLQVGYWSGSAWTNQANSDTSAATPLAGTHLVTTGWVISGATTRAIVVYNNSAATVVSYRHLNPPSTWTPAAATEPLTFSPTPAFGNPQKWYDIQMDPFNKDTLLFTVSDVNSDLFAKRLVMTATPTFTWTDSDGGAALQLNLAQTTASPFSFSYWRKQ